MIANLKQVVKKLDDRFKKLPEMHAAYIDTQRKADAVRLIDIFVEGIENDSFGLKRLKPETVREKQRKGYPQPDNPLMGMGGDDKRLYRQMLMIRKLKNGYRIRPSDRKHHKANISLKTLFYVHEYGKTIFNGKVAIVIPARPAGKKAFNEFYNEKDNRSLVANFAASINEWIVSGRDKRIKNLIKKKQQEAKNYDAYH